MSKVMKSVFFCMAASCCMLNAQEYEPGRVVPEIRCKGASDYSYILYLPKSYDPAREEKWPVLFLMGPDGGTTNGIQRYIPGADQCNWILAMSIQSKNENDGPVSHAAITAMVEDVFTRFPVNKKRCYASGKGVSPIF
jgi:hypothetical protein